jgi:hypothetical protein
MLLLRVKSKSRRRLRRVFPSGLVSAFSPLTRIMGGTDGRGFYGNQALGGAISAPVVTTFPVPIPAGAGLVVYQSTYDYTPSNAALLTLSGSGNALTLSAGAQTAHNATGGNDNSVSFFHAVLASDCTSCTYDASSLAPGDTGRYGQMVFYVVRDPDTVNGFYTCTPVTNSQTSTTSVNPGTLTLPTTDCLELFGAATRGHADDLLPVIESPDEWDDDLKHTYFDTIVGLSPGYPAAFMNSVISSGPVAGRRKTGGGTSTPVWTFTGPNPTTASAHSVHVAYNILNGVAAVAKPPFTRTIRTMHRRGR